MIGDEFYIIPEDIYRLGNSSSPKFNFLRPDEIDIIDVNESPWVVANARGVSVYNKAGMDACTLTGWVWKVNSNITLPQGLVLVDDDIDNHYVIAPDRNMPLSSYKGLLEQLLPFAEKVWKKTA